MVNVEGARYRIRDIATYRYVLCSYQDIMLNTLWAAAGLHGMLISTVGHDPAVAVCDDRVVDDHGVVVLGIDLDPEAFGVVVDHVVRDQIVGAFDVHAMALVLPGEVVPAVVVDPVAEDLD